MISFPNLPTDSLYKFMFIGGLFIFALSAFMAYNGRVYDAEAKQLEFKYNLNITTERRENDEDILNGNIILDKYTRQIQPISKELRRIEQGNSKDSSLALMRLRNSKEVKVLDSLHQLHKSLTKQMNDKWDRRSSNDLETIYKINQFQWLSINFKFGSWIFNVLGVFMMLFGGMLWYQRIQKYQDKILQLQVAELEQKLMQKPRRNQLIKYQGFVNSKISGQNIAITGG